MVSNGHEGRLLKTAAVILTCAAAGATASCAMRRAADPTVTPATAANAGGEQGQTMLVSATEAGPEGATPSAGSDASGAPDPYRQALSQAYREFRGLSEGKNADYIPALAKVDPALYGIVLVTVQGAIYEIGSARNEFSIQSISKPLTLARAIDTAGIETVRKRIGVNATGQKFNSILAIELNELQKRPQPGNPFVNAGAIATVDLLPAATPEQKWDVILGMYSAFAGRRLAVDQEVYRSESETNTRNRAISQLLKAYEVIKGDPGEALDLYTRQCSVSVSARDLAVMGATLANGGRNPITRQQVVSPATAREVLAVMATAGMYETTGEWMVSTGLPAKSGVGGGIVAVMPGRYAVGTFSPPLDDAGNSVRGMRAIESMVKRLGGGVFAARASATSAAATAQRGN